METCNKFPTISQLRLSHEVPTEFLELRNLQTPAEHPRGPVGPADRHIYDRIEIL